MNLSEKWRGLSLPAKAGFWFTICIILQRGIQFIGMPILTRIMSENAYGTYTLFVSWFNLFSIVTSLSIYAGTFNVAMVKYKEEKDDYTSATQLLTILTTVVFSILVIAFHDQISALINLDYSALLLMCANLLMFPPLQYWSQRQRFEFKYKAMIVVTLVNSGLGLALSIVGSLISGGNPIDAIAGLVLIQCAVGSILFIRMFKKVSFSFIKKSWIWTLHLSLPLLPHYIAESCLSQADRVMIGSICGAAKAGIYGITYQISMAITVIRQGFNGAFAPWLYQTLDSGNHESIRSTINFALIFMSLISVAFILIAPEIMILVVPPSYYEAIPIMPPVICGCFYIYLYTIFLYFEVYFEKPRYAAIASVIAAIINIVLNLICIPFFGFLSAAYTTMVSYAMLAFMHYLFYRRIVGIHPEIKDAVNTKFVLLCGILVTLCTFLLLLIYPYALIRYLLLVPIACVAFFKRKKIKMALSSLKK